MVTVSPTSPVDGVTDVIRGRFAGVQSLARAVTVVGTIVVAPVAIGVAGGGGPEGPPPPHGLPDESYAGADAELMLTKTHAVSYVDHMQLGAELQSVVDVMALQPTQLPPYHAHTVSPV
jgi:hypothetical protein